MQGEFTQAEYIYSPKWNLARAPVRIILLYFLQRQNMDILLNDEIIFKHQHYEPGFDNLGNAI